MCDKSKNPKQKITLAEYYSLLGLLQAARTARDEIEILENSWQRFLDYKDENAWFSDMIYDDKTVFKTISEFIKEFNIKILNKEIKCRQ